jgi:hypothetical protein
LAVPESKRGDSGATVEVARQRIPAKTEEITNIVQAPERL